MWLNRGAEKEMDPNLKSHDRPKVVRKFRIYPLSSIENVRTEPYVSNETPIVLIPFKTLVSYPFSFPFGKKGSIRDALTLNLRPVLGNSDTSLILVPQVTEQASDLTKGVAWLAAKSEIAEWESRIGTGAVFWPAPIAFVSEVNGSGIVVWCDDEGSSAMWFDDGEPIFYRWMPDSEGGAEQLAEWVLKYAESNGRKIDSVKIFRNGGVSQKDVQFCGEAAIASLKGLDMLDLSSRGADMAEQTEAFFNTAFKTAKTLSILGVMFVVFSAMPLIQGLIYKGSFDRAPAQIYRRIFGEESGSPLMSVNRKLKMLTGNGTQMTLEQTLSNFSAAWKDNPSSAGMKLDSLRYGAERTEIQGLAGSMDSIQSLRDLLNRNGFTAKVGEVQQVPGSGMRFSISLTGAKQ